MTSPAVLRLVGLIAAIGLTGVSALQAQPAAPPPPAEYKVQLRYRIFAPRNQRLVQLARMEEFFHQLGFHYEPLAEDERADSSHSRLNGTIAAAKARRLLEEPHVRSLLLIPSTAMLPAEAEKLVKVQLELVNGLEPTAQRLLWQQSSERLRQFGFREFIGADHRGFSRLLGLIPTDQLEVLLRDLRAEPSGWLAPELPLSELPEPIRSGAPIRVSEVLDVTPMIVEPPAPAAPPEGNLSKVSADLLQLLGQDAAKKPARFEVILNYTPAMDDRRWLTEIERTARNVTVEGRLGPLLTVFAPLAVVPALADMPVVSTVRLPRPAKVVMLPTGKGADTQAVLKASGLERLHTLGRKGQGTRIAIIGADFRGVDQLIKAKQFPTGAALVDLTAERSVDLLPDAYSSDSVTIGAGTLCAQAAHLAAPAAALTLIRVDPAAPYMVEAAARFMNGEVFRTECMRLRGDELLAEDERLRLQQAALIEERKAILANFGQDEASVKQRQEFARRQAELDRAVTAQHQREQRYLALQAAETGLKGIRVVAATLSWPAGYPVDGSSSLSRYFDDRPFKAALWFQAAGDIRDQTWAGLFRDQDGNGVMEFAPLNTSLSKERWTSELNFLGWQPINATPTAELPQGKRIRISLQWREAHDPSLWTVGDVYREPLAPLTLLVLRQTDPAGKTRGADELDLVAKTTAPALRLDNAPNSATYEQVLEFIAEPAGRYTLRLEGMVPPSTRPASVPTLPAQQQRWELQPRLFIEVLEGQSAPTGRPIFLDFPTTLGSLSMPGDAHANYTVGSAQLNGASKSLSAPGPAQGLELQRKPDIFAYDQLALGADGKTTVAGTAVSCSFAAGVAAAALSNGAARLEFLPSVHVLPGTVLRLP